jgi:GNAT superfamily N-acetyltransferase
MDAQSSTESDYSISTNKDRLDLRLVHRYLSQSAYWAMGRSYQTVVSSVRNSLCFAAFAPSGDQVGFARVVTDYSTFAWLCDVFVLEGHRGRGLGKRLVEAVTSHPDLKNIPRILLATRDAHELYRRYAGFGELGHPERWMVRLSPTTEDKHHVS